MRLWSLWNSLSSCVFFIGVVVTWVIVATAVATFLPPIIAWTLMALVVYGFAVAVLQIYLRHRKARRSQEIDADLAEMTGHTVHRKPQ